MSTISAILPTPPDRFSTQIASASVSTSALSIDLDTASGLGTEGVGVLLKKNASGEVTPGSIEFVHWTGVAGNTITLTDTGDRGLTGSDSGAQSYVADDYFEVWVNSYYAPNTGLLAEHNANGTHKAPVVTETASQTLTNKTLTSPTVTSPTISGTLALSQSWDGWIAATDTWTYASATTFTIAGVDRTALFPKGTKIKLTQTTTKYFVVTGSAFSTNTTITIKGGTDYSLANATITSPAYSYAETPQGYPNFFNQTSLTFDTSQIDNGTGGQQPTITNSYFTVSGRTVRHVVYMGTAVKNTAGPEFVFGIPSTMPSPSIDSPPSTTYSGIALLGGLFVSASVGVNPSAATYHISVRKYDGGNISDNQSLNSTAFSYQYNF